MPGVLRLALATNPATPAGLLTALAGEALPLDCQGALAAHPNLPLDHPALTDGWLAGALTRTDLPSDRAHLLAAASPGDHLIDLLLDRIPPHAAVPTEAWVRGGARGPAHTLTTAIAVCPTTPPPVRLAALRHVITQTGALGDVAGLTLAATTHPGELEHLAAACVDPHLAASLREVAARPDPGKAALAHMTRAAREGSTTWAAVLALSPDAGARAALASGKRAALAEVAATPAAPGRLRVRALRTAAHGELELHLSTRTLTDIAEHLTDGDMAELLPAGQPLTVLTALLTGPGLTEETMSQAWSRIATGMSRLDGTAHTHAIDLVGVALTIAAHPATSSPVRDAALHASRAATTGGRWGASLPVLHATAQVTADPTRTPLPALIDRRAPWLMDSEGTHAAGTNLVRTLSGALTTLLLELSPAAAEVAGRLLPTFTGTFEDLVTAAAAITT